MTCLDRFWRTLKRAGISRPPRQPRERARLYEWPCPGDLLHIDSKRFARFTRPGHALTGDRHVTGAEKRMRVGYEWVHSLVDDHSRLVWADRISGATRLPEEGVRPGAQAAAGCSDPRTLRRAHRSHRSLHRKEDVNVDIEEEKETETIIVEPLEDPVPSKEPVEAPELFETPGKSRWYPREHRRADPDDGPHEARGRDPLHGQRRPARGGELDGPQAPIHTPRSRRASSPGRSTSRSGRGFASSSQRTTTRSSRASHRALADSAEAVD